jgi:hypothetical protein
MQWIGKDKPLSRSQPALKKKSVAESVELNCMNHTITFGYKLSYSIQTLQIISYHEPHLDADNRGRAKYFEVPDATSTTDAACNASLWLVP